MADFQDVRFQENLSMNNNFTPIIDSNVIIYAVDRDSLYHAESVSILQKSLSKKCFLPDIALIEFFQVITDGKKVPKACTTEEAVQYIRHFLMTPEIEILQVNIPKILSSSRLTGELKRYGVVRYAIYDYLIACCMRDFDVKQIVTFNAKDFMKYEWVQVVYPPTQ